MHIFWIVLIIIIAVSYIIRQKTKKIDVILRTLALGRNGKIKSVFGAYPQLTFQYKDIDILVSAMSGGTGGARSAGENRPPQTFAQFYSVFSPDNFFFRIRGKSTQTVIEKVLGFKDIQIGEPLVDNQFFIQGKDDNFARELLTQDIQRKIIDLNKGRGIEISFQEVKFFNGKEWVEKPRFDITIHKVSTEYQDYTNLIETAISFYEQMKKLIKT